MSLTKKKLPKSGSEVRNVRRIQYCCGGSSLCSHHNLGALPSRSSGSIKMTDNQRISFLDRVKQQRPSAPKTGRQWALEDQITRYMDSLTTAQRNRPWSIAELLPHLTGAYQQRPATRQVAQALQNLGWAQKRDWTKLGRNRRLWVRSR